MASKKKAAKTKSEPPALTEVVDGPEEIRSLLVVHLRQQKIDAREIKKRLKALERYVL